jgi:quercetin dioxygenase-like cupin family protein
VDLATVGAYVAQTDLRRQGGRTVEETAAQITSVALTEIELAEGWVASDPRKRGRFAFPLTAANGCASSSVIYFEVQPGDQVLRHIHSAEEVILILEGTAEVEVGGETGTFGGESLLVVPALVPHALFNVGETTLRVVGFFSAAAAVHTYEAQIEPFGTDVIVTPVPEELMAWRP